MIALRAHKAVATAAVACVALFAIIAINSTYWLGRAFPGFLVMENRVVASVTLPGWLQVEPSGLFQREVVAVDGITVPTSDALYAYVQSRPPGTSIAYTLRAPSGASRTIEVPSRRFSGWDYARLFAAYLLTGVAFCATGLLVFLLKPESSASRGLLSTGLSIGIFALTGADLYAPHWFFRLHVTAETLAPGALLHLALVFPTDRLRGKPRALLAAVYLPFALLAAVYQVALSSPPSYTTVHVMAVVAQGMGAAALILSTTWAFFTSGSPLVRRRIGIVALGAFAGFLVPGVIGAASALTGGSVAVNLAAFTVFLFPVSLGYAILRRDLFEIDTVFKQATSYVIVALAIGAAYMIAITVAGTLIPSGELVATAPVMLAIVNTALVFLVGPLRTRTQAAVDRLFSRDPYDVQEALAELSSALAAMPTIDAVVAAAGRTLSATLAPMSVVMYLREQSAWRRCGSASCGPEEIVLAEEVETRLSSGGGVSRYEWDDGSKRPIPAVWDELGAELIMPMRDGRGLVGILALGRRRSGRTYTGSDVAFLRTVASQLVLGVEDARLLDQLEQKQASLIRADRLATLGRLASGLAHEMGSPIGAILSSLRVLAELGKEYATSIGEPSVLPDDHREIADEIVTTATKAIEWAEKAGAFLKNMNKQAREPQAGTQREFRIADVVSEIGALMAHRLRASSTRLDFEEDSESVTIAGDPSSLGQVLANLIGNAIDAYEDIAPADRRVLITAQRHGRLVRLTVRDWAGGMPPEVFQRIFDELYTTKDPGRGTGLGLWISRNLIEQTFAGTLTAETEHGVGTSFVAVFPAAGTAGVAAPVSSDRDTRQSLRATVFAAA